MFTVGDIALPSGFSDFCILKISYSKQTCRKLSTLVGAVEQQRELHPVHHSLNLRQPSVLWDFLF